MILSTLSEARRYSTLHDRFGDALAFLESLDPVSVTDGRLDIDGDDLFAIAWEGFGKGQSEAVLESHRKYIDIQYVVSGTDVIGWRSIASTSRVKQSYDESNDLAFFFDQPESWFRVPAKSLAIFFPEDTHAPLATTSLIQKVVVKVRIA